MVSQSTLDFLEDLSQNLLPQMPDNNTMVGGA